MNLAGAARVPPAEANQPAVAVVAAVPFELEPLQSRLAGQSRISIGRKAALEGTIDEVPTILLAAGMGKANAAHGATALLETRAVRGVLGVGVAGAYPGSGLAVGQVALASSEIYGDDGVDTPGGWLSTREIGIPLLKAAGEPWYNEFPLDPARVAAARAALAAAGIVVEVGPFVTVSNCSGTARRGAELAERFGGLCESMEGAALAHVCALYEVPFLEVRGISNLVEDRDLARWRLAEACSAAARAARILLPLM